MIEVYDLLVKGGLVIDPSRNLHTISDIAIERGIMEAVERDISPDAAKETIDASGLLVTPGLIDLHVHVYRGVSHYGIDSDIHCLSRGVTTVVDAGSSGADTFEGFRRYVVDVSATRIFALLNISCIGMVSPLVGELEDIRFASVEKAIEVCERNRDLILGVKVRLSKSIVGENGIYPLRLAKRVAEAVKMPVMVHPGDTPVSIGEILGEMDDRDILTHCFHGNKEGILGEDGEVLDEVWDALKREVVFDVGHGRGSFSFDVAAKALSRGVVPHTISSDLHKYNVFGPVFDLATTASKFLYLGLSLDEVFAKITSIPARLLRIDGQLGTIRSGSIGDLTVFSLRQGDFRLEDTVGKVVTGKKLLEPLVVVKGGRVWTNRLGLAGDSQR